jgi:hypothetical protein
MTGWAVPSPYSIHLFPDEPLAMQRVTKKGCASREANKSFSVALCGTSVISVWNLD